MPNDNKHEETKHSAGTNKTFVTQGPVSYKLPVYISRETDDKAFKAIANAEYLTVFGPRQMGKTSLLQKLQMQLREEQTGYGFATTFLDFMEFNMNGIDWETWIKQVCTKIRKGFAQSCGNDLSAIEIPVGMWDLSDFFINLVNATGSPSMVILFDEAVSIPLNIRNSFYSVLRTMHNRRNNEPVFNRCNFVFAGVFEPDKLVENDRNSPFNVSTRLMLSDFTLNETKQLLQHLAVLHPIKIEDDFVETVYQWSEGHPNLTHRVAALLNEHLEKNSNLTLNASFVDSSLIPELMHTAGDNIDYVARLATDQSKGLDKWILRTLNGKNIPRRPGRELELIGAVRRVGSQYRLRNKIYERELRGHFTEEEFESDSSGSSQKPPRKPDRHTDPPRPIFKVQVTQHSVNKIEIIGLQVPGGGDPKSEENLPFSLDELRVVVKMLDSGNVVLAPDLKTEYRQILINLKMLSGERLRSDFHKVVGEGLFKTLISRSLITEFETAKRMLGSLVFQLRFDPEDVLLAQFPWELIHNGNTFLVPIKEGVELTRYITFPEPPPILKTELPLKVLYIAPRPKDEDWLPSELEKKAMLSGLATLENNQILWEGTCSKWSFV